MCRAASAAETEEWQMEGRAALVTGGSSGIGLAIARMLGADGYGVTVSARRPDKLESAVAGLRDDGMEVEAIAANVIGEREVLRRGESHRERCGRLDVPWN